MFIEQMDVEFSKPSYTSNFVGRVGGGTRVTLRLTDVSVEDLQRLQAIFRGQQGFSWRDVGDATPAVHGERELRSSRGLPELPGGPKQLTAGPEVLEGVIIDDE
jgi:hypothetical protein